jgi:DNA 3'-phosphatase
MDTKTGFKWVHKHSCFYHLAINKDMLPFLLFDYDETLADLFTSNPKPNVIQKLIKCLNKYNICIISNQMGILKEKTSNENVQKNFEDFIKKLENIQINIFYATCDDLYRKPNPGMMNLMTKLLNPSKIEFYCGDAAGRNTDFGINDLYFANNNNIPFILPEDFFEDIGDNKSKTKSKIGEKAKKLKSLSLYKDDTWDNGILCNNRKLFDLNTINDLDSITGDIKIEDKHNLIIMVGPQACGKSTLSKYLSKKYNLGIINLDTQKTKSKMNKVFKEFKNNPDFNGIIIDNTNPDNNTRNYWLSKVNNWNITIIYFNIPKEISIHLTKYRMFHGGSKIPSIAINIYYKKLIIPKYNDSNIKVIEYHKPIINSIDFNYKLRFGNK